MRFHGPTLRSPRNARLSILVLIAVFIGPALACNLLPSSDDGSLRQTDIALGIQQTLVAQTATALPLLSLTPVQPSEAPTQPPAPSDTPVSQPIVATEAPVATEAIATEAPAASDTPIPPTAAPAVEATPVSIVDWGFVYFVKLNSGCFIDDVGCWRMDDDYKKHMGSTPLSMTSKTAVKIDPSWPRPYLVFWHKYKFEATASVDIQGGSTWSTVKILNKQRSDNWKKEAIDLEMFKGKDVTVRFIAAGIWGSGGIKGSQWFINDVQIVPDYTP